MFKKRTKVGKIIGYSGYFIFLIGVFSLVDGTNDLLRNTFLLAGAAGILASNFFRVKKDEKQ
ncbi:hypothetical protein [Alkalihalobacterium chitinilyticum]|uniref:Uncharacterized protein n=1 Tax=Alkalihalobacterium chitinilyticum TaxID=2980103 RepID=A0ABT5VI55_9BACI|nr:hypothetical protein [Alkalihalobacterium chitinilyticum]MDE5415130.1 hypothetical protein [Alkalihalobacterium chitinilyticum]